MDAIKFPDLQSEDADAVLPALQHTVSQAMQVSHELLHGLSVVFHESFTQPEL